MQEPKYAKNLAKGDLCLFTGYLNRLHPGVFRSTGSGTLQFYRITERTAEKLEKGEKPSIDYIGGECIGERVVKIDVSQLPAEEQSIYNRIKEYDLHSKKVFLQSISEEHKLLYDKYRIYMNGLNRSTEQKEVNKEKAKDKLE